MKHLATKADIERLETEMRHLATRADIERIGASIESVKTLISDQKGSLTAEIESVRTLVSDQKAEIESVRTLVAQREGFQQRWSFWMPVVGIPALISALARLLP